MGGRVQSSKLIKKVEPVYPRLARQARIQGVVLLRALIDEEGRVAELKVISGPGLLRRSALDAVRQWRYTPTYLNGRPVDVATTISVTYRLR